MRNMQRSLVVNLLIIIICVVLFKSVSYSSQTDPTNDNKDLLIQTGNMQVVLNIPNERYELLDSFSNTYSDLVGVKQKGYQFSIKNIGNIPIEYYEIRLVDQEGKISTLPHKYLRFTIAKDDGVFEDVKNLGENDSIIYSGYNLDLNKTISYNLKMWIDDNEINAIGKELYGAIEVVLYQKYDVYQNYVLYDSPDSIDVPIRTSIYNPISSTIPKRDGYKFMGWMDKVGNKSYLPGDTYNGKMGVTLYAIWDKV